MIWCRVKSENVDWMFFMNCNSTSASSSRTSEQISKGKSFNRGMWSRIFAFKQLLLRNLCSQRTSRCRENRSRLIIRRNMGTIHSWYESVCEGQLNENSFRLMIGVYKNKRRSRSMLIACWFCLTVSMNVLTDTGCTRHICKRLTINLRRWSKRPSRR